MPGEAAANAGNGNGVSGDDGGCSEKPLKEANSDGSHYYSTNQSALNYDAEHGADEASKSYGAANNSDHATDDAHTYAYNGGETLLAASGNENASTINYPATTGGGPSGTSGRVGRPVGRGTGGSRGPGVPGGVFMEPFP